MGRAYKNFWSLNTDEAVVTGILRGANPKKIEVFMPINAQMKDIDLILMNMENKRVLGIQVKGSRAYEPKRSEVGRYGSGSAGWFYFGKDIVLKSTSDYFIFLIYVIEEVQSSGRRIILPHTLIIPTNELKKLCKKKKVGKGDKFNFFFWVNPVKKEAFDFRGRESIDVSEYLDKKGFEKLYDSLN